jgi:hypothetical protein
MVDTVDTVDIVDTVDMVDIVDRSKSDRLFSTSTVSTAPHFTFSRRIVNECAGNV